MIKIRQILYTFLLSILFTILFSGFSDHVAEATTVALPDYYIKIDTSEVRARDNTMYPLVDDYKPAEVYTGGQWETSTTVEWTSTNPQIVNFYDATTKNYTDSCTSRGIVMHKNGPGYTTIQVKITNGSDFCYISFLVCVELEINETDTGTTSIYNDGTVDAATGIKQVLEMKVGQTKPIKVYKVDYSTTVSGSAIRATDLKYDSSNKTVATVSADGTIKAVGSGSATITVTNDKMTSSRGAVSDTILVVVTPTFSLNYSNSGTALDSFEDDSGVGGVYVDKDAPSKFTIVPNTSQDANLTWVVYRIEGGTKTAISKGTSTNMTYTENNSGTLSFSGVKTGTYELYAYAYSNSTFAYSKSNLDYAYMKIYVKPNFSTTVTMGIGDTYDFLENSNISSTGLFKTPVYNESIIDMNTSSYVITGKDAGTTTIILNYNDNQNIYDNSLITSSPVQIKVTVIDGISLSANSATIYKGGSIPLYATRTDMDTPISWSSDNTSVATVTSGVVTGVATGTATITVTQKINGVVKKATCKITVVNPVETVTIKPTSANINKGDNILLIATVTPSASSDVDLVWKSSNESVATVVGNGLNATVTGTGSGTVVIAAINKYNVVVGYCTVTVKLPVKSIALSETNVTVSLTAKTMQLDATVNPQESNTRGVLWTSTDTTKATVAADGTVTLKKAGTVTIIATSADDTSKVAYCVINITTAVVSVALDSTTKSMNVGDTSKLVCTVLPVTASNVAVTWSSSNTGVATVDSTGKVTAKKAGTATITVRTLDGNYSATCNITVTQSASAIRLDVSTLNLKTSEFYVFKPVLSPNGSTGNTTITWISTNTKVATVDNVGKVVAKSTGTAIIMASIPGGNTVYCTVTVTQAVSGLVLNYSEKTAYKGETFTLVASVTPSGATNPNVTWKSSNTGVATITDKGVVNAVNGGLAILTCTTTDGGYAATCVITVKEAVASITLNHKSYKLGLNKKFILTATVTNGNATNQNVRWTSSNDNIATVSAAGKVTGIKAGHATITAIAKDGSDVEASCSVRVVKLVAKLKLNVTALSMYVGDTKKLKATISPKNATYKTAKWSSSDTSIAVVNGSTIIALKAGTVTITASAKDNSGKKAACYVTVSNRVAATAITIPSKSVTMVRGNTKTIGYTVTPSNSTDKISWSTDNAAVATVNKYTGRVTAKSPGTANITVMTSSGKTATIEVKVLGLNQTSITAEQYTNYSLSVDGTTDPVSWHSDNTLVAVVYSGGTISTRGEGNAVITATVDGVKLTCRIKVRKIS